MARTLEQIEESLSIEKGLAESFGRLMDEHLPSAERQLEMERRTALMRRKIALEAADAPPPPPPVSNAASLAPAEAAKRAAELRKNPLFFGRADFTQRAEQERLHAEVRELVARSLEGEGS